MRVDLHDVHHIGDGIAERDRLSGGVSGRGKHEYGAGVADTAYEGGEWALLLNGMLPTG